MNKQVTSHLKAASPADGEAARTVTAANFPFSASGRESAQERRQCKQQAGSRAERHQPEPGSLGSEEI